MNDYLNRWEDERDEQRESLQRLSTHIKPPNKTDRIIQALKRHGITNDKLIAEIRGIMNA